MAAHANIITGDGRVKSKQETATKIKQIINFAQARCKQQTSSRPLYSDRSDRRGGTRRNSGIKEPFPFDFTSSFTFSKDLVIIVAL